jgi:hypothetical protein
MPQSAASLLQAVAPAFRRALAALKGAATSKIVQYRHVLPLSLTLKLLICYKASSLEEILGLAYHSRRPSLRQVKPKRMF